MQIGFSGGGRLVSAEVTPDYLGAGGFGGGGRFVSVGVAPDSVWLPGVKQGSIASDIEMSASANRKNFMAIKSVVFAAHPEIVSFEIVPICDLRGVRGPGFKMPDKQGSLDEFAGRPLP